MTKRERALVEEALREVDTIEKIDRDPANPDSGMAYAHALGRATGCAINAGIALRILLERAACTCGDRDSGHYAGCPMEAPCTCGSGVAPGPDHWLGCPRGVRQ